MALTWRRVGTVALLLAVALPASPRSALARGPALLIHGNYCGLGNNGTGAPPVDALDAACARHDACTPDGALADCACNERLRLEASYVAGDPRQPDDLRSLAGLVAGGAALIACVPGTPGPASPFPPYASPSYVGGEGFEETVPYDPYGG